MTDPYTQEKKDLAAAVAIFIKKTGAADFVIPEFVGSKTIAVGDPEFIREHLPSAPYDSATDPVFQRVVANN